MKILEYVDYLFIHVLIDGVVVKMVTTGYSPYGYPVSVGSQMWLDQMSSC